MCVFCIELIHRKCIYITVFRFCWSLLSEQATLKGFFLGAVNLFGNIVPLVNISVYFFIQTFLLGSIPKQKRITIFFHSKKYVCIFMRKIDISITDVSKCSFRVTLEELPGNVMAFFTLEPVMWPVILFHSWKCFFQLHPWEERHFAVGIAVGLPHLTQTVASRPNCLPHGLALGKPHWRE